VDNLWKRFTCIDLTHRLDTSPTFGLGMRFVYWADDQRRLFETLLSGTCWTIATPGPRMRWSKSCTAVTEISGPQSALIRSVLDQVSIGTPKGVEVMAKALRG
jgi:hypothetical protein